MDGTTLKRLQQQTRGESGPGHDAESPNFEGLLALSALLKGLPEALMLRQQQTGQGSSWMPELAVPRSLMLAVYPGEWEGGLGLGLAGNGMEWVLKGGGMEGRKNEVGKGRKKGRKEGRK